MRKGGRLERPESEEDQVAGFGVPYRHAEAVTGRRPRANPSPPTRLSVIPRQPYEFPRTPSVHVGPPGGCRTRNRSSRTRRRCPPRSAPPGAGWVTRTCRIRGRARRDRGEVRVRKGDRLERPESEEDRVAGFGVPEGWWEAVTGLVPRTQLTASRQPHRSSRRNRTNFYGLRAFTSVPLVNIGGVVGQAGPAAGVLPRPAPPAAVTVIRIRRGRPTLAEEAAFQHGVRTRQPGPRALQPEEWQHEWSGVVCRLKSPSPSP